MAYSRNKNLNRTLIINGERFTFTTAIERNAFRESMNAAAGDDDGDAYADNIEVQVEVAAGQTIQPGSFLIDVTPGPQGDDHSALMLVQAPAANTAGQDICGMYRGTEVANAGDTITMVLRGQLDAKINGTAPAGVKLRLDNSEPSAASFGEATDSFANLSKVGDAVDVTDADFGAVFFFGPFITV